MTLVPFSPNHRRTWMVPRCKRALHPWKVSQITNLVEQLFAVQDWGGNQERQNRFVQAMNSAGLKSGGNLRDPNSGGARTYLSQLEALGIVFKKKGQIYTTLAGENISNGKSVLKILQNQLMTFQYPSTYSSGQNLKIHPSIRIKPFLFLLALMQDDDLGWLTVNEMQIPVAYGHNWGCYDLCKEKILTLRKTKNLLMVLDDPEKDLYTTRAKERCAEDAITDLWQIANTFKNYLTPNLLAYADNECGDEVFKFNNDYLPLFLDHLKDKDQFIPNPDNAESYQRAFGAYERQKDQRQLEARSNKSSKDTLIQTLFFQHCGESFSTESLDQFIEKTRETYGFSKADIENSIEPLRSQSLSIFESSYLEMSVSGGTKALEFEKATGKIFRDCFSFDVTYTGQKKRVGAVGAYADLFLLSDDEGHCGIIDTKSTRAFYPGHDEYNKMIHSYIPSYLELCKQPNTQLEFAGYVSGGLKGDVSKRMQEISSVSNTPSFALTAKRLLDLSKDSTVNDQQKIRQMLRGGGVLS